MATVNYVLMGALGMVIAVSMYQTKLDSTAIRTLFAQIEVPANV